MLGLGLGTAKLSASAAVVVEDYFWELDSAGVLKPLATGVTDFNEVWDLDGTDYTPVGSGWISTDEGYWELDTNDDMQPLDV